jgi:dipeptidyl aminopeptidase/acylaminoacyl peptidase
MAAARIAPYGSWASPLDAASAAGLTLSLGEVWFDHGTWYWLEGRPHEQGRQVIVKSSGDAPVDVTPRDINVRSRVHEYGGGAYAVRDGVICFSNFADGQVHRLIAGGASKALTPPSSQRYADLQFDPRRGRIMAVNEDHSSHPVADASRPLGNGPIAGDDGSPPAEGRRAPEPANRIVAIDLEPALGSPPRVLVSGSDFYASPRVSPDGTYLAWLSWNHPHMPWDSAELWLARFDADGSLTGAQRIAGGPTESAAQPEWSPDGRLYFAWDRSGWWNLYRIGVEAPTAAPGTSAPEQLTSLQAEFGRPHWTFGTRTYGFLRDGALVAAVRESGTDRLVRIDVATGQVGDWTTRYSEIDDVCVGGDAVALVAGNATEPVSVVLLSATGKGEVLRRSSTAALDPAYVSTPQAVTFPGAGGSVGHAVLYAPQNPDFDGPDEERPPLIVRVHGGPIGSSLRSLNLTIQFFTTRGFAVMDVDYAGTTGYGRAYRERLHERWGVADLDDCVAAAQMLADRGVVDGKRMAIRGGSAGGYTTLCAMAFRDTFAAGVSLYGIADLELLASDTHKFEAHSMDWLVGPYPATRTRYRERSPIHAADRIRAPLLILQGLDDRVVPPNQAQAIADALERSGIPHAFVAFEGEDHGFRRAENLQRALEAEVSFYAQIFGITIDDPIPPVQISHALAY